MALLQHVAKIIERHVEDKKAYSAIVGELHAIANYKKE
jgi:hypothetical protein